MFDRSGIYTKKWGYLTILLLISYLICGLRIFRDYGASADEINQIEAGHITWTAVCEQFGKPAPDFGNLPKLKEYYNRYYGQAATFPTVIVEALKNFQMDISSVLRLRHLWNFFLYITGLGCFCLLLKLHSRQSRTVFFALLLHILTPRLFGDAFYNDRDVMLISLLWISFLCYELFRRQPGIITAFLCAFSFATAINTRFFALILIFLPLQDCFAPRRKKAAGACLIILTFAFWYLITPVFWGNFFTEFAKGFQLFSTGRQRTQETNGLAELLFFGKYYRENDLPFYYLPLWMLISTPVVSQLLAGFGLIKVIRKHADHTDRFMQIFLCAGVGAVMVIRPVLYNGWRHLYFFCVPLFWFTGYGLEAVFACQRKRVRPVLICALSVSAVFTAIEIRNLHPYEYIYLNPVFRSQTGKFEGDYWRLSTSEGLKWIWDREQDEFRIGETNADLDNSLIGLFPYQRSRIIISQYASLHRFPPDYLIYNYSGTTGEDKHFPLYQPVYEISRNGLKLSEVFKRETNITPQVRSLQPKEQDLTDGKIELDKEWRSEFPQSPEEEIVIEFSERTSLHGISLIPGNDENEYARHPEVSVSEDGKTWTALPFTVSGLFDLSFPETETKWLRVRCAEPAESHWSVREILFYQARN